MKLLSDIKRHPFVSLFIVALGASLAIYGYTEGRAVKMMGYLSAVLLSALTIDYLAAAFETEQTEIVVRSPRKELILMLTAQAIVLGLSVVRFQFFTDWQTAPFLAKLPVLILMLLFVFPVVPLIAFLKWGYSFRELGFRFRYFWFGIPVIVIFGLITYFFAPEDMQFGSSYQQLGIPQMILVGFLVAATPEELVRYLTQTRLGRVLGNYAVGWVIAALIWALLHLPNFYAQNTRGFVSALWGVVAILPLGLLWSFMNHRTRSIIPAVLVHGTNLWGLHDF